MCACTCTHICVYQQLAPKRAFKAVFRRRCLAFKDVFRRRCLAFKDVFRRQCLAFKVVLLLQFSWLMHIVQVCDHAYCTYSICDI